MKLLLTSAGITNNSIKSALVNLVDKNISQCYISFIPTAANVEEDAEWMYEDIETLKLKTGVPEIHMIDIEKLSKNEWLPILEKSDIICMGGGNTYHLLYWIRKSGLREELKELLKTKVYIGISAGSIVVGPDISINRDIFPEEECCTIKDLTGLQYIPFAVTPHYLSRHFPKSRQTEIEKFANQVSYPIYAIDDNTAIKVIDNQIEIVSEEKWKRYN